MLFIDEVFVKINSKQHYLWRPVDQDGEVVDVFLQTKTGWGGNWSGPNTTEFLGVVHLIIGVGWLRRIGSWISSVWNS